jgi:very-short-patch-repair endonuclease
MKVFYHFVMGILIIASPLWGGSGRGEMRKRLTPIARDLRNDPTEAEKHLWHILRSKSMGFKFRRQAVIGLYVVDFVCYEKKLVIEVDGGQHCQNQKDIIRDEWLKGEGFTVVRFWNNEVLENLDGVFEKIEEYLAPLPFPPHKGEGDK